MKNNAQTFGFVVLFLAFAGLGCNFNFGEGNSRAAGKSDKNPANSQQANVAESKTPTSTTTQTTDDAEQDAKPASIPNGQTFFWQGHGVTIVVPPDWKKRTSSTGQVIFGASGGASVSVDELVSTSGQLSPHIISSDYDFQQSQKKQGKVEEVRYLTISGVRGVFSRDAAKDSQYDSRVLRWKGYRTFQGRPQVISIILTATEKEYAKNRNVMEQVLYNVKFTEQ